MRTFERSIVALSAVVAVFAMTRTYAFDGTASPDKAAPVSVVVGPGSTSVVDKPVPPADIPQRTSLSPLPYQQVDDMRPAAQWKLGRMYADGVDVPRDEVRAFQYFSRIANQHADDSPFGKQAEFVANAFVALGRYYTTGIANSAIKPDPERAREMFTYAASYFGNADAQYNLARMYLDGTGIPHDFKSGTRWLGLAAQKGQHQAQALLGQMLFNGEHVQRQAARGLMWLTLAQENATSDESWIHDSYTDALEKASDADRAMALQMLQGWVQGRRD